MALRYVVTQRGSLLFMILACGALGAWFAARSGYADPWPLYLVAVVLGASAVFFSAMTVTVDDRFLRIGFVPKFVGKRIPLDRIDSFRVVRNPRTYGWGVRRIPGGWLFGVSGTQAVEVRLESGKVYRIGTKEPEELCRALKRVLSLRRC